MQPDAFEDNKLVKIWPNSGDKSNYFPIIHNRGSIDFGPIVPNSPENFFELTEIFYQHEQITIRDGAWPWSNSRSYHFANVEKTRKMYEWHNTFKFKEGTKKRHLIKAFMIGLNNSVKETTREMNTVLGVISKSGGLMSVIMLVVRKVSSYFGAPMR